MPEMKVPAEEANVVNGKSKEEIQMIKSFKVPEIPVPFRPPNTNPHAETAVAEALQWVKKHSLDKPYTAEKMNKISDDNAAVLPTMIYVDAGKREMAWVSKYYIWVLVLDDQLDEADNFKSPENSSSLQLELNLLILWSFPDDPTLRRNLKEFLDNAPEATREATIKYVDAKLEAARKSPGTVYDTSKSGPLCTSVGDLWTTLVEAKGPGYQLRWGQSLQRYLIGNMHESIIRNQPHLPSVAEYIPHRRNSVGMDPLTVIVEYLDNVDVPDELFESPELQDLLVAVDDIVAWHNDIWSFKKELLNGDIHNLVYLLSIEKECSYTEAAKIAVKMLMDRVADLERISNVLLNITPPEHKHAISRYVINARYILSGVQDWHIGNKRYNF